jgi:hypothetical protein
MSAEKVLKSKFIGSLIYGQLKTFKTDSANGEDDRESKSFFCRVCDVKFLGDDALVYHDLTSSHNETLKNIEMISGDSSNCESVDCEYAMSPMPSNFFNSRKNFSVLAGIHSHFTRL